ncbi:GIY-YIG nuclease family protein [Haloferax volcanii]|uniref:GIY-YIG nuclease family protein n=1 Tax=Haloferax volcanii TaxID=2246 RepID=A0A6C0UTD5_HALVO|nr:MULTISPECIES: GIY-YIG nuclease family protein [Haloferax]QIB78754.1 GIY-YIG nuclease family protein [Haloferax alexandrinus]WEL25965.1 Uri superfamily endonuclease [Haloferax lucentense]
MTEPNHSTDDAPTIHSLDPAALGTDDDPLALGSRSPVGTYALVFDAPEATVEVGALGEHRFPAGAYVYVGSAFGTGGLRRVRRHRRVAAGDHDARHWHVDYLGGHPAVDLARVVCVTDRDVECAVATELASSLGSAPIDGFGSSDCSCDAHLARGDSVEMVTPLVEAAFRSKM